MSRVQRRTANPTQRSRCTIDKEYRCTDLHHINTFRYSLDRGGVAWDSDEEAVTPGLELLLTRIPGALELAGGIDNVSMEVRRGPNQTMAFADDEDFEQFLFLLGRFLAPHFWFATNLRAALETNLQD